MQRILFIFQASILLRVSFIGCAPKLGHIMFDPLLYEAHISPRYVIETSTFKKEKFDDDDDWLGANLRMTEKETTKVSCSGYDFNENYCKTINDRIVCGYNKNIEEVKEVVIDLGNGCRVRNDRLECGYLIGPFGIPRRPPANDDPPNNPFLDIQSTTTTSPATPTNREADELITTQTYFLSNTKTAVKTLKSTPNSVKASDENSSILITNLKTPITTRPPAPLKSSSKKPNVDSEKECVEKGDHIFCYYIKRP